MASIIELLEEELEEAVQVKNKKSLHRYITLLVESLVNKGEYVSESGSIRTDIRVLTETVLEGFKRMDQRFAASDRRFEDLQSQMNARFEASDKRFDDLHNQMNVRFEVLQNQMNARFEASDKRFDDLQNQMNVRFEVLQNQMNVRVEMLQNQMNTVVEASDKRFELSQNQMSVRFEAWDTRYIDLQKQISARFEDVNRRFNMMFAFMTVGFTALTVLVSLYKFIVP